MDDEEVRLAIKELSPKETTVDWTKCLSEIEEDEEEHEAFSEEELALAIKKTKNWQGAGPRRSNRGTNKATSYRPQRKMPPNF